MQLRGKNLESVTNRVASTAIARRAGLLMLAVILTVAFSSTALANSCSKVGGSFSTNFIAEDQTAGTATGDLKGSLGVKLLGIVSGEIGNGKPLSLKVVHFWVTEAGDTLITSEAILTAYPAKSPTQPLLYSFVYEDGVKLTGGTGKFEGASGLMKAWGAVDLAAGEVTGRYAGNVCLKPAGKR